MARWAVDGARVEVVTATRGEAGQIRNAALATRRTLGAVREEDLRRACARLGVSDVTVLDHLDGTLRDLEPGELITVVEQILVDRDPDVVVTFGADGAYGHPDHIAVGEATAAAIERIWATRGDESRPRLLRSHFPRSRLSLADRLATWLVELQERFGGVVQEIDDERHHLRTLGEGQFFGELGVVSGAARSASVIAVGNVTCLVLSPSAPTKYDGRGGTAKRLAEDDGPAATGDDDEQQDPPADGVLRVDVTAHVGAKLAALAAHRTQYPIDVEAFPRKMLEEMFGVEYFVVHRRGDASPA